MKKLLSFLLVVVLLITVVPLGALSFTASAKNALSGITGNCAWTLDGTVLTISGSGEMGYYSQYTASNDRPWDASITEVIIENGVTNISDYAFSWCNNLKKITIPNSVTSIGDYAFNYCSLTSVTIPGSVTIIGNSAFYSCDSLTSVTIGDSVKSIGDDAFRGCTGLTSVTIGDSVTSIGKDAFLWCENLKNAYITDIAAWCNIEFSNAFANPLYHACNLYLNDNAITDLVIPDGVTSIGDYAFNSCDALTSVTIPNSVTSIGSNAFSSCDAIKTINYNAVNCRDCRGRPFAGSSSITTVNIGDGVGKIPGNLFYSCTLRKLYLTNSVESVGADAFYDCTALEVVYFAGTQDDWLDVAIENGNNILLWNNIIYESESNNIPETDDTSSCTAHKMGSWRITQQSTCTQNGEQTRECRNCGETEIRTIETSGHVFKDPVVVKEPTISSTGLEEGECIFCGEKTQQIISCIAISETSDVTITADEGVFPEGTKLDVTKIDSNDTIYQSVKSALSDVAHEFVAYYILAGLNGADLQLNGTVEVTFDIPDGYGKDVVLYFVDQNGSYNLIDCEISEDGKTISAEVSELGIYAVCKNVDKSTDLNNNSAKESYVWVIIVIAVLIVLVLGIVVAIIIIKKKSIA